MEKFNHQPIAQWQAAQMDLGCSSVLAVTAATPGYAVSNAAKDSAGKIEKMETSMKLSQSAGNVENVENVDFGMRDMGAENKL